MGFEDFLKNIFKRKPSPARAKPAESAAKTVLRKKKIETKPQAKKKTKVSVRSKSKKRIARLPKKTRLNRDAGRQRFKVPHIKDRSSSREKEIGAITHYFGKIEVGIVKLTATLSLGDTIHIKGAHDDFTQIIESMQIDRVDVPSAKKGDEIGIKVRQRVREFDRVYLVSP